MLAERRPSNARSRDRCLRSHPEEDRARDAAARRHAITLNRQGSCPYVIGGIEHWDVDDPAWQPLGKVREIRDDIEQRVRNLAERRADEFCAGRKGQALRLTQLLPKLAARV